MKREALNHPKIRLLARDLGISILEARGLMVTLWTVASLNYPRGDIGRLPNDELAVAIDWPGDADTLVQALVARRLLDCVSDEQGRLLVHDWHEHADDLTQWKIARSRTTFANGAESKRKFRDKNPTATDETPKESEEYRKSQTNSDEVSSRQTNSDEVWLTSSIKKKKDAIASEKKKEPPLTSFVAPQGGPTAKPADAPGRPSPTKPRSPKTPKRPWPADLVLTEAMRAYAVAQGVADPDGEFDHFRDSAHAHGRVYADWGAAWKTWARNANQYGRRAGPPRPPPERHPYAGAYTLYDCPTCGTLHEGHYGPNGEEPTACTGVAIDLKAMGYGA